MLPARGKYLRDMSIFSQGALALSSITFTHASNAFQVFLIISCFFLQMALSLLTFNAILEWLQCTSSLPTDILQGPAGPHIADIRFCPQIRMLHMQHVDLPYLETLVTKDRFQPQGAVLEHASSTICILLNFLSHWEYTSIHHVHIRLVVMCQGFQPSGQ